MNAGVSETSSRGVDDGPARVGVDESMRVVNVCRYRLLRCQSSSSPWVASASMVATTCAGLVEFAVPRPGGVSRVRFVDDPFGVVEEITDRFGGLVGLLFHRRERE